MGEITSKQLMSCPCKEVCPSRPIIYYSPLWAQKSYLDLFRVPHRWAEDKFTSRFGPWLVLVVTPPIPNIVINCEAYYHLSWSHGKVWLGLARTYRLGGKNPTYNFDSAEPDLVEHPWWCCCKETGSQLHPEKTIYFKTRRRMAQERRRACYSVVNSIKDIVGQSFIEDDADDQQKGDRNAMSVSKQK